MPHPCPPAAQRLARRALPCLTIVLGGLGASIAQATVLLFDQTRNPATGVAVVPVYAGANLPGDYGDRVAGTPQDVPGGQYTYGEAGEGFTPNVVLDFSLGVPAASGEVQMWTAGYGGLNNVVFGTPGSQQLIVGFTADPGYRVRLHGFDLAGYPGQDYTIAGVTVHDGTRTLFAAADVVVGGDAFGQPLTRFSFDTALSGDSLRLQIDYANIAAARQDNIGLDNLRFSQVASAVPEPAVWGLLMSGLALLAWRAGRQAQRNG